MRKVVEAALHNNLADIFDLTLAEKLVRQIQTLLPEPLYRGCPVCGKGTAKCT